MLEITVEYASLRRQFGRTIGSFQAVKHRCADMFIAVEAARSVLLEAQHALTAEEDARDVCAVAKIWCSDKAREIGGSALQVFGGIGFTWEHDSHLYFKRAQSSRLLLGDPDAHRALLERRLGLAPGEGPGASDADSSVNGSGSRLAGRPAATSLAQRS